MFLDIDDIRVSPCSCYSRPMRTTLMVTTSPWRGGDLMEKQPNVKAWLPTSSLLWVPVHELHLSCRLHFLGQCTDLNAICRMVATTRAHLLPTDANTPEEAASITRMRGGYTFSQPLSTLADMPLFPIRADTGPPSPRGPLLVPHPWTPKFIPKI